VAQAEPLNIWQRIRYYLDQTGRGYLTPKQSRRARRKDDKHLNGGAYHVPNQSAP
jgi:hypothetical protein